MAAEAVKSKKKHLSVIIRVCVALLAIGFFLKGESLAGLWGTLKLVNPLVFAVAVALYAFGQFFFVLRWRLLLKVLSIDISIGAGIKLHLLGLFYNNCLPGSVGGDLLRAWYVTKHAKEDRRFEAALSVFVDRAIGVAGMITMAGIFYWLVPVDTSAIQKEASQVADDGGLFAMLADYKVVILYAVGAILLLTMAVCFTAKGRGVLGKIFQKTWLLGMRVARESISAARIYSRRPFIVLFALFLTFLCQSMTIYGFYLIGQNIGMGAAMKYFFVFFPLSWLAGVVPVSIGGLGVVEGFLKELFKTIGVEGSKGAAIAVCQRLVLMIVSVPGFFVHIFGTHLPSKTDEFFIDSDESMD